MSHEARQPVWDDWNRGHIAKHRVTVAEAEWVLKHAIPPFPRDVGDRKWVIRGVTREGRFLQVIYALRNDEDLDFLGMTFADMLALEGQSPPYPYVVHARDLTDNEKRQLRRTLQP